MNSGWIKLHRQIRNNPIYKNSKAVHVWIECLLRASHNGHEFFQGREMITLMPGQFLMGREEFGASIGMSGSTAWFWLQRFKSDSQVDIVQSPKGSIVTVKNWSLYQDLDSDLDNKKTANKQQINTIKKVKNGKNEKIYNSKELGNNPEGYGNPIIKTFKKVLSEWLDVLPTGQTDKRENQVYWNALQHLGVKKEMLKLKSTQDLPIQIRDNMNNFIQWLAKDMNDKRYTLQKADTVRVKAKFFRDNILNK